MIPLPGKVGLVPTPEAEFFRLCSPADTFSSLSITKGRDEVIRNVQLPLKMLVLKPKHFSHYLSRGAWY